jgi:hypothetical protein
MNAIEIEEAVSELVIQPFDPENFPFTFLEAFGNKETTLKRLKNGGSNQSDIDGGVLQRSNIHLASCPEGKVSETLSVLRESPATAKHKAVFILATDGKTLEAENVVEGETIACDYVDLPDHFGFFLSLAGILLLYKEKLLRLSPPEHPELLILSSTKRLTPKEYAPADKPGRNTVGIEKIKERFKDYDVKVDWPRFDAAAKLRMDIEHYYTQEPHDAVKEIVASSFLLIRDFLNDELEEDPIAALGEDVWGILLDTSEIYGVEKQACLSSMEATDWEYDFVEHNRDKIRCTECGSSLILVDSVFEEASYRESSFQCRQCNHKFEYCEVAEEIVHEVLRGEIYYAVKDGGEPPVICCPGCEMETYLAEDNYCVNCGYEMKSGHCVICHGAIDNLQGENGLCDYHQYLQDMEANEA